MNVKLVASIVQKRYAAKTTKFVKTFLELTFASVQLVIKQK